MRHSGFMWEDLNTSSQQIKFYVTYGFVLYVQPTELETELIHIFYNSTQFSDFQAVHTLSGRLLRVTYL